MPGRANGLAPGDPARTAPRIIESVDVEPAPLRMAFGSLALESALATPRKRIAGSEARTELAASTDFPPGSGRHRREPAWGRRRRCDPRARRSGIRGRDLDRPGDGAMSDEAVAKAGGLGEGPLAPPRPVARLLPRQRRRPSPWSGRATRC
jgi:hypothetical protein